MKRSVAVVGAGWSGLACALELTRRGHRVTLFDAAPQAGGRARSVELTLGDREYRLDNGQHLLIGAYRETLRLMREVGVDADTALLRLPFELRYPDGFALRARRLPAPLHLAFAAARGLDARTRLAAALWMQRMRRARWRIATDAPAASLFEGAPPPLRQRLWRPLCLAALNAELEHASAQVLLNVLRDSLGAEARAGDLLLPCTDLSRLFADPALQTLRLRGAAIELRQPVQRLRRADDAGQWQVEGRDRSWVADDVVLAVPAARAATLLQSTGADALASSIAALGQVETAPIITVYLRYPSTTRLPRPLLALLDDAARGRFGQWVFDRGQLDGAAGVLSVVISAAHAAAQCEPPQLATAVAAQLTDDLGLPSPDACAVIAEKRATIVPAPNAQRPQSRLPARGLYLAGDAAASDYPSTLEGSVRAGIDAALAIAG